MTRSHNIMERRIQIRNTRAMIDAAPLEVILHRTDMVRNARAGIEPSAERELDPQIARILHSPPRRRRKENTPPDVSMGEIPFAKDNLMGLPDMDIQKDDWFEVEADDGNIVRYVITYVFLDRTYETIANLATTDQ